MLSTVPNMRPADTCFGIWSTVLAANGGELRAARADGEPTGRLTEGTGPEMRHRRCSSAKARPRQILVVTAAVDADIKEGYARETVLRVARLGRKGKRRNAAVVAT